MVNVCKITQLGNGVFVAAGATIFETVPINDPTAKHTLMYDAHLLGAQAAKDLNTTNAMIDAFTKLISPKLSDFMNVAHGNPDRYRAELTGQTPIREVAYIVVGNPFNFVRGRSSDKFAHRGFP